MDLAKAPLKLVERLDGAMGYFFLWCSGLGRFGDAQDRRISATFLVATWLCVVAVGLFSAFSFWVFDLMPFYHRIWPYESDNPRSIHNSGFALFLVTFVPSFAIAFKVGKRFAHKVAPRVSWGEGAPVAAWYAGTLFSALLCRDRYGALIFLVIHALFFSWVLRATSGVQSSPQHGSPK